MRLLSVVFLTMVTALSASSLWKDGFNLYSEHKARKVGDIVTVSILETASATQRASTTNKENTTGAVNTGQGFMKFIPLGSSTTTTGYNGNGTTYRNNDVRATVTSTVTEILPNGTYRIEGRRKINVNSEIEEIVLSGIVRDEDIGRDNTIESSKIAEATVTYTGRGVVTDSQKPGLVQRLLQAVF